MTRYRTPYGEIVDGDDLFEYVEEEFTAQMFSNWLDDNYSPLRVEDFEITPTEILEAMGDFESCHEDCIYEILEDSGGIYPTLEDLGFRELADYDDSESVRSAMAGVRDKGRAVTGKVKAKAKKSAPKGNPKAASASRRGVKG